MFLWNKGFWYKYLLLYQKCKSSCCKFITDDVHPVMLVCDWYDWVISQNGILFYKVQKVGFVFTLPHNVLYKNLLWKYLEFYCARVYDTSLQAAVCGVFDSTLWGGTCEFSLYVTKGGVSVLRHLWNWSVIFTVERRLQTPATNSDRVHEVQNLEQANKCASFPSSNTVCVCCVLTCFGVELLLSYLDY